MTKELIERLRDTASKGVSVWGDLQMEAADALEQAGADKKVLLDALKAYVDADQEDEFLNSIKREAREAIAQVDPKPCAHPFCSCEPLCPGVKNVS